MFALKNFWLYDCCQELLFGIFYIVKRKCIAFEFIFNLGYFVLFIRYIQDAVFNLKRTFLPIAHHISRNLVPGKLMRNCSVFINMGGDKGTAGCLGTQGGRFEVT